MRRFWLYLTLAKRPRTLCVGSNAPGTVPPTTASLPACLEITAWTQNEDGDMDEIMGVRHKELAIEGVQFHPESILTQYGHELLQNFLNTK